MNEQAISQPAGDTDEDTIELELSSTDLLCSLAEASPAECQDASPEPGIEQSLAVPSDATTPDSGATATPAEGAE